MRSGRLRAGASSVAVGSGPGVFGVDPGLMKMLPLKSVLLPVSASVPPMTLTVRGSPRRYCRSSPSASMFRIRSCRASGSS